MIEILCIGHACYDISIPLESFPEENSKTETNHLLESGGGPAANAAYLLSKWGIETAFAGLIGADTYGEKVIEEFCSVGTVLTLLEKRPDCETPLSFIIVNKSNGSRTIINRKSKRSFLDSGFLENKIKDGKFIDGSSFSPKVLLFDGHEPDTSLRAMELFPDAKTILDAGSLRPGTEVLSRKVDFLVSSERFALSVSGLPHLHSKENLQKCINLLRGINDRQVVVTMGENGLIYNHGTECRHLPAYASPYPIVDTTAAGDIFHGAFAYGILKGFPLEKVLNFAAITASLSVRAPGGRQSIPPLKEVYALLNNS